MRVVQGVTGTAHEQNKYGITDFKISFSQKINRLDSGKFKLVWFLAHKFNPFIRKSDLKTLLCLTPDDFSRQRETLWG